MTKIVQKIPSMKQAAPLKKVAAYARVSTEKDAMLHSLSAQISYYSNLIQSHSDWQYAGVYSDEAISGTKTAREGINQLIQDCRDGKVDMILTKSVSRFARNTVMLLQTVRELKALGVDVYFEEQNIHTISADGELMLTILASYAQEESLSNSENMKWRIRHGYEEGDLNQWRKLYGYKFGKEGISVDEEKAPIIREVFQRVVNGESYHAIAKDFNARGIPLGRAKRWEGSRILSIIRNEKYSGNALLQKTFVNNHIEKKHVKNTGQLPMYYVENSHPAIVDMDTFQKAQEEADRRLEKYASNRKEWKHSLFFGMIRCGDCGANYQSMTARGRQKYHCDTYLHRGKSECPRAKAIPEEVLIDKTAQILGLQKFDSRIFRAKIDHILVPMPNHLVYVFKDGHSEETVWQDKPKKEK